MVCSGLYAVMCIYLCRFIRYCELEQGYTGFDYKDAEGEEDVVSRLASLKISSDGTQAYITLSNLKCNYVMCSYKSLCVCV